MSTIDDLQNKVTRLRDELHEAEKKLRDAVIAAYPIPIGTTMTDGKATGVLIGVVAKTNYRGGYRPDPIIRLHKKDGTVGQREAPTWRGTWKPVE